MFNEELEPPKVQDVGGYTKPPSRYLIKALPSDFENFLENAGAYPALKVWKSVPGAYICGGAVRAYHNFKANRPDVKVRDIDMYFVDNAALHQARAGLTMLGLKEVAETERAVTFIQRGYKPGPPIQLIRFVYGDLETILNEFDYTVIKLGASLTEMVSHVDSEQDLADQVLRYCGSQLPLSSLARAIKYTRYGYKLPAGDLVAILKDIRELVDLDDPSSMTGHITKSGDVGAVGSYE